MERNTTHLLSREENPVISTQQGMLRVQPAASMVSDRSLQTRVPCEDKAGMLLSRPVGYPASAWGSSKAGSPTHSAAALVCPACSQGN